MAIKLPDPGNGIPEQKTGNDEWTNMNIVRDNFADQSNAASRLVGKNSGNLLEAGTGGIGWTTTNYVSKEQRTENGFFNYLDNGTYDDISGAPNYQMSISTNWVDQSGGAQILIGVGVNPTLGLRAWSSSAKKYVNYRKIYYEGNTTKDSKTNLLLSAGDTIPENSAASRLVGNNAGNLLEVGAHGLGSVSLPITDDVYGDTLRNGFYTNGSKGVISYGQQWTTGFRGLLELPTDWDSLNVTQVRVLATGDWSGKALNDPAMASKIVTIKLYSDRNTTKDSNGFIKAASPVVDLYDDHIELNYDAQKQNITFKKVDKGEYLVQGSLGFAQEGWYIEMPKDANGNVLVAVVYEQLDNNDISIKTYDYMLNKKGRIVPDTETPLDIPEGRCINLRLHEVKEQLDEPTI